MHLQVSSPNLDLSPKMLQIINQKFSDKLDALLHTFNEEMKIADLMVTTDKLGNYKVRLDLNLPGKNGHIYATFEHQRFISAITGLRERIEKQIKKYKKELSSGNPLS